MAIFDLLYCNISLPLVEKKSPKILELSNFDEIFSVPLLMNDFHWPSVILFKKKN